MLILFPPRLLPRSRLRCLSDTLGGWDVSKRTIDLVCMWSQCVCQCTDHLWTWRIFTVLAGKWRRSTKRRLERVILSPRHVKSSHTMSYKWKWKIEGLVSGRSRTATLNAAHLLHFKLRRGKCLVMRSGVLSEGDSWGNKLSIAFYTIKVMQQKSVKQHTWSSLSSQQTALRINTRGRTSFVKQENRNIPILKPSFPRTKETATDLLSLHEIVSETMGGLTGGKKRKIRNHKHQRRGGDSSPLQTNLRILQLQYIYIYLFVFWKPLS